MTTPSCKGGWENECLAKGSGISHTDLEQSRVKELVPADSINMESLGTERGGNNGPQEG